MGTKDVLSARLLGSTDKMNAKQVGETLDKLVSDGVIRSATDIHIEPHDRFVLVRLRIDGALRGVHKLPLATLDALLTGLKKRAGLDTGDNQMPQEGEYTVPVGDQAVRVRVATMPVFGGEKATLHLAKPLGKPQSLESLGFWGQNLAALQAVLASPHGLVLVAGPRHSGASTTLFSLLDQLNHPIVSIATVELQPKHRLPGVAHSYTHASGLSVADGLKAALAQDPNIVLLGDIPDSTTASLAVHASSTGHFIVARVHTDSAVRAVLHLRAAGAEPFLLASTLKACVSQRLVRSLCPDCRERYTLSPDEHHQLSERFGMTTPAARRRVHELERSLAPVVFGDVKQLNSTANGIVYLWRPHPEGCQQCGFTGYQGRTAIVEVIAESPALHKALLAHDTPTTSALHALLLKEGFVPMALDGLVKALRGQTTINEVLRAIGAPVLE